MLTLLRDLARHKGHANAAVLRAVRRNPDVESDNTLFDLAHHVLLANRFWICAVRRVDFDHDIERTTARPNGGRSWDALVEAFRRTQEEEVGWLATATDADCAAVLEHPLIPGGRCTVADAWLQLCLHSHGHRAQLAKLLRGHGVVPPETDFILWKMNRPEPRW